MTTEDLQGQVARSAAVERELREEIGKLRAELAEAKHRLAEIEDIDICRLQLPDGRVPGGTVECARMWHAEAQRFWKERDAATVRATAAEASWREWLNRAGDLHSRAHRAEDRATAAERDRDEAKACAQGWVRRSMRAAKMTTAAESALAEARGALRDLRTTARNVLLALVEEDDGLIHDGPEKGEARCEPYAVCILCGEDMLADGGRHDPLRPCGQLAAAVTVGGDLAALARAGEQGCGACAEESKEGMPSGSLHGAGEQANTKGSAGELGDRSGHAAIEPGPAPSRNAGEQETPEPPEEWFEKNGWAEIGPGHWASPEAMAARPRPIAGEPASSGQEVGARIPFPQAPSWGIIGEDPYSDACCSWCGKPIDPRTAARIRLTRTNDGEWWALPVERPVAADEKDFGHFVLPIGPDCLHRHPELRPAMVAPTPPGEQGKGGGAGRKVSVPIDLLRDLKGIALKWWGYAQTKYLDEGGVEWAGEMCAGQTYALASTLLRKAEVAPAQPAEHPASGVIQPVVGPAQDGAGADLPLSGIPLIDHDYVPNTWPKRDECDKRVSDDPDGRPSRQCGRPRREHRTHGGGK